MNFWTRRKALDAIVSVEVDRRLKPTLSWPHLLALGIGAIIGTGIYTLTGILYFSVGYPAALFVRWLERISSRGYSRRKRT